MRRYWLKQQAEIVQWNMQQGNCSSLDLAWPCRISVSFHGLTFKTPGFRFGDFSFFVNPASKRTEEEMKWNGISEKKRSELQDYWNTIQQKNVTVNNVSMIRLQGQHYGFWFSVSASSAGTAEPRRLSAPLKCSCCYFCSVRKKQKCRPDVLLNDHSLREVTPLGYSSQLSVILLHLF